MAGQIIPRGRSKWLVRIYVGVHPKTGKRNYVGKVINGTKKDAQAYLNAKLREQDIWTGPAPADIGSELSRIR